LMVIYPGKNDGAGSSGADASWNISWGQKAAANSERAAKFEDNAVPQRRTFPRSRRTHLTYSIPGFLADARMHFFHKIGGLKTDARSFALGLAVTEPRMEDRRMTWTGAENDSSV
jgi:hypothetical protein